MTMERTYKITEEQAMDLFSSDAYFTFNKKTVRYLGLEVAAVLANLIDRYTYIKVKGELINKYWFTYKNEKQAEEIGLSVNKVRNGKRKLKELGVLETKMIGNPSKESYRLHIQQLSNFLRARHTKIRELGIRKSEGSNKSKLTLLKTKKLTKKIKNTSQYFPREWQHNKEFRSSLKDFTTQRNNSIYPLSELSIKKIVTKLTKYTIAEAILALDDAVAGSYRGLFPKKDNERKPNTVGYKSQTKHTKGQKL